MAFAPLFPYYAPVLLLSLFLATIAAFLLSSVAGGGAGLILMPIIALIVPVAQAPAALTIGTATSSVSRIMVLRRHVRWDVVRWFLPAALPFAALGATLLVLFDPVYIQLVLGLFLLANLRMLFSRSPLTDVAEQLSDMTRKLLIVGAAAGFLSGFTGAVGLLFNRFYQRLGLTKEEIVATRAMNEVLLHLTKIFFYMLYGLLTSQALYVGLVVAVGAIAASLMTPLLLARLQDSLFRRVGVCAMVLAGVSMTTSASSQVIVRNGAVVAFTVEPDEVEMATRWRRSRYSAEIDLMEGVVLEKHVAFATLSPALQRRIVDAVGKEELISVEKTLRLTGRDWELEFRRDGKIYEVNILRQDNER